MAELERLLLPLLLLAWGLVCGLCVAYKRFRESAAYSPENLGQKAPLSQSEQEEQLREASQSIDELFEESSSRSKPESENPYTAPSAAASPAAPQILELPLDQRPPRSGIHASTSGNLVIAIGLILWYGMQVLLSSLVVVSQEAEFTTSGLILSFLIQIAVIGVMCSLVLGRIAVSSIGLHGWLGLDFTPRQFKQTMIALVPIILATYLLNAGVQYLFEFFNLELPEQPMVSFLREESSASLILVLAFFAVVVAPLSEELIFRGYLYPVLGKYCGRVASLFLSASFFGLIHGNLSALLGLTLLALLLTRIYERTGSLWAPIFVHAVFNGISVLLLVTMG